MAAVLEQALTADLKEGGAADGQAPAEGVGGQPDRVVHGSSGGGCLGQRGRLPKALKPEPAKRLQQRLPPLDLSLMLLQVHDQLLQGQGGVEGELGDDVAAVAAERVQAVVDAA